MSKPHKSVQTKQAWSVLRPAKIENASSRNEYSSTIRSQNTLGKEESRFLITSDSRGRKTRFVSHRATEVVDQRFANPWGVSAHVALRIQGCNFCDS
ncbi:hypothetical protein CEXT_482931 [Caerostris extrusa]|uniref:Uncharacterized protein n=1 Tax=Caerostris extrusa TaxID=172846 RepID=A0AAV4RUS1_CAEEX|nr:hypothetical protein CEXT_482931 [Caerostris extrusa]